MTDKTYKKAEIIKDEIVRIQKTITSIEKYGVFSVHGNHYKIIQVNDVDSKVINLLQEEIDNLQDQFSKL